MRKLVTRFRADAWVALLLASVFLSALSAIPAAHARAGKPGRAQEERQGTIRQLPPTSKRWALVIGVDEYGDPQISRPTGAANDAATLAQALVQYAGFPQDQVILLDSNQPGAMKPSRSNILRQLSALRRKVPSDGLLLVSFAGHGIERGDRAFVLPSDAVLSDDAAQLEQTAISVEQIKDSIRQTGVGQVFLIIDAFRNAPSAGGDNPLTANFSRSLDLDVDKEVKAFVTLYATSVEHRAYEDAAKRQGYFSWALIEGLRGAAANANGQVTLANLLRYLQTTVPSSVQRDLGADKEQRPFAIVEGYRAEELVLALVPRTVVGPVVRPATPETTPAPTSNSGNVSGGAAKPGEDKPDEAKAGLVSAAAAALVTEFDVNGLKVLVKRRAGSQTVASGLFLRGGSRNITAANAGIESLMLDVATEGSVSFPRERLRTELARMGTVLGASENYDYSVLSLTSTRSNFDRSWEIFTDVALRPAFTKEDFDLVKSRVISSLQDDSDDPDTYLQRLQEKVAYAGHPYLNRPQGTAETVSRLTLDDVRSYHQQMMQTSRLLLVVVGDLDPAQVRASVEKSFGKLPRGGYKTEPVPQLTFNTPTVEITQRGLPTNYINGVFTAPPLTANDIHAMQIASSILRDRVFEEVRVKRNLSYAPNAFLGSQGANLGGIYVTAVDANQAVRVMLDEIKRLQTQPISQLDITGVVSQYLTTYYLGQETNAAQAASLAEYELIGGGWRHSFDMLTHLRAVSPADVQRVAQKYMRNIRFVVLGDPNRIDKNVFTGQMGE